MSFIRLDVVVEIEGEDKIEVLEKVKQFLKDNNTPVVLTTTIQQAEALDYWIGL